MKVDNENSFKYALTHGINFFAGAGFSILAKDVDGNNLPLGNVLRDELAAKFNKSILYSLPTISTMLESTNKGEFYKYLTERFSVASYDPLYNCLNKICIKSFFTTNIDNLFPKIVLNSHTHFINNQYVDGPTTDKRGINYMPLHGYVDMDPHQYIFDVASIANVYHDSQRVFGYLSAEIEKRPTVFIGYGFNDSSVIQALTSQQTFQNAKKEMWILLREEDLQYREYYEAMHFSIIEGDICDFLHYVESMPIKSSSHKIDEHRQQILAPYMVPHSIQEVSVQRPIKDFYTGSEPLWCDIINNQIYKTHYYNRIRNLIFDDEKNVIILGAPVSGKTTLLKQIAFSLEDNRTKLFFSSITKERAEFVAKILGDCKVVVFIDNLADCVDALEYFNKKNIKIVGAERSHNFGVISHLVGEDKYNTINVTQLTNGDLQGIYDALPSSLRTDICRFEEELSPYGKDSVFEFVIRNVQYPNIRERYKDAIANLEVSDYPLAEFVVLCAYMHSCHVPLSFDMAYDYFSGVYQDDVDYQSIFDLRGDAEGIIHDYVPCYNKERYADMDYYYPRSRYAAEIIIASCSSDILSNVLWNVVKYIGRFRICDYGTFRKYSFDKLLALRAFPHWKDGMEYYKEVFLYDNRNPYVLQQGALYLSQKHQHDMAFKWIDQAINMTDDKHFSIRNSHAIIKFNANYAKDGLDARHELDDSMQILERCMTADSRKRFHAYTYGNQAIQYYEKYKDDVAKYYIEQAKVWVNHEVKTGYWDYDLIKLNERLGQLSI